MALMDSDRQLAGAILTNRFVTGAYDVIASVAAWNDARVTRNALSKLTLRELDDIGLSRADIDAVARRCGGRV